MNEECGSTYREPWYQKRVFPLIPIITFNKGDEWNSTRIGINWLFFMIWDSMTPWPEFNLYFEGHGTGFRLCIIPYISFHFKIPFPYWTRFEHEWFWRRGRRSKFKWMR